MVEAPPLCERVLRIVAKENVPGPRCDGRSRDRKAGEGGVSRLRRGEGALRAALPAPPRGETARSALRNGARYAACALLSRGKDSTAQGSIESVSGLLERQQ